MGFMQAREATIHVLGALWRVAAGCTRRVLCRRLSRQLLLLPGRERIGERALAGCALVRRNGAVPAATSIQDNSGLPQGHRSVSSAGARRALHHQPCGTRARWRAVLSIAVGEGAVL